MWFFCFILGALTVLGFAPFELYLLPFVTLGLLFLLWQHHDKNTKRIFWLGFWFGLGFFLGGVHWVYTSLVIFGGVPVELGALITVAFCGFLALYPAATGALTHYLAKRCHYSRLAWFAFPPIVWCLMEWVRGWLFTGFPWLRLGATQVSASPLVNLAPIGGELLISLCVTVLASLLADFLNHWQEMALRERVALWFFGAVTVGFSGSLGQIAWTHPTGSPLMVSLLQGNVPQDTKWDKQHVAGTLGRYLGLTERAQGQLIIFPETALPLFSYQIPESYWRSLARAAQFRNADLLVGVPEKQEQISDEERAHYFNSLITLGTSSGQVYRKSHLVPFGEYIPARFMLEFVLDFLQIPLLDFTSGPRYPEPLTVGEQKLAISICYEDAFGNELIRQLPAATLLVNVSNDAWFGSTIAPWQHLQLAQLRALETGRMMLRANNTGVTAIIDHKGRVVSRLPVFAAQNLEGVAQGFSGITPYIRWGNGLVLTLLFGASSLLLVFFHRRSGRPG